MPKNQKRAKPLISKEFSNNPHLNILIIFWSFSDLGPKQEFHAHFYIRNFGRMTIYSYQTNYSLKVFKKPEILLCRSNRMCLWIVANKMENIRFLCEDNDNIRYRQNSSAIIATGKKLSLLRLRNKRFVLSNHCIWKLAASLVLHFSHHSISFKLFSL